LKREQPANSRHSKELMRTFMELTFDEFDCSE